MFSNLQILLTDDYYPNDPHFKSIGANAWVNNIYVFLFIIELFLRTSAESNADYLKDNFNKFDMLLLLLTVIYYITLSRFTTLIFIRQIRILRISYFRVVIAAIKKTMKIVYHYFAIQIMLNYIFTLIGMQLFAGKIDSENRDNFNTFGDASLTVFKIIAGDNWNEMMYSTMRATNSYSSLYFIILIVVCNVIMLNLLLAIIISVFISERSIRAKFIALQDIKAQRAKGKTLERAIELILGKEFLVVNQEGTVKDESPVFKTTASPYKETRSPLLKPKNDNFSQAIIKPISTKSIPELNGIRKRFESQKRSTSTPLYLSTKTGLVRNSETRNSSHTPRGGDFNLLRSSNINKIIIPEENSLKFSEPSVEVNLQVDSVSKSDLPDESSLRQSYFESEESKEQILKIENIRVNLDDGNDREYSQFKDWKFRRFTTYDESKLESIKPLKLDKPNITNSCLNYGSLPLYIDKSSPVRKLEAKAQGKDTHRNLLPMNTLQKIDEENSNFGGCSHDGEEQTFMKKIKSYVDQRSLLVFHKDSVFRQHLLIFMLPKERLIPREGYNKNPEKYQTSFEQELVCKQSFKYMEVFKGKVVVAKRRRQISKAVDYCIIVLCIINTIVL